MKSAGLTSYKRSGVEVRGAAGLDRRACGTGSPGIRMESCVCLGGGILGTRVVSGLPHNARVWFQGVSWCRQADSLKEG